MWRVYIGDLWLMATITVSMRVCIGWYCLWFYVTCQYRWFLTDGQITVSMKVCLVRHWLWFYEACLYTRFMTDGHNHCINDNAQSVIGYGFMWNVNTTGKSYGIFGKHNGDTRIWHFDLLEMIWQQPQTSIVTWIQQSCVDEKCNLPCQKLNINIENYRKVSFFILCLTFPRSL